MTCSRTLYTYCNRSTERTKIKIERKGTTRFEKETTKRPSILCCPNCGPYNEQWLHRALPSGAFE